MNVFDKRNFVNLDSRDIEAHLLQLADELKQQALVHKRSSKIHVESYGSQPLLVSASHATPHIRDGHPKKVDKVTGAIALALAQALNSTVILPSASQLGDPNWDKPQNSIYKTKLSELMPSYSLFVDIHGMRDCWHLDICLGAGQSQAELSPASREFIKILEFESRQASLKFSLNQPFAAHSANTTTGFVRQLNKEAFQVELALCCRQHIKLAKVFDVLRRSLVRHPALEND